MKKANKFWAIMFCLFVVPMVFSSCNKDDDDDDSINPSDLIGTWRAVEDTWKNGSGSIDYDTFDDDEYFTVQFKEDGTYVVKWYYKGRLDDTVKGTYTAKNGKITFDNGDDGDYKISGNKLTIYGYEGNSVEETVFTRVD